MNKIISIFELFNDELLFCSEKKYRRYTPNDEKMLVFSMEICIFKINSNPTQNFLPDINSNLRGGGYTKWWD